jgi:hypothetical protein
MAYIIYNNDGSVLANIANGDVDSSTTSLDLIGKNVDNYGQYFNNDLVKLLTNFASPTTSQPRSPQTGQLWFNTTLKKLTVYDGTSFNPTYGATVSGTPAIVPATGDLWYDTINSQLKIWNGSVYKLAGPAVSGLYGKFGIEPPSNVIREYDTNVPQKVGILYSYGSAVGLITTSSFSMSSIDSSSYLNNATTSTIVKGVTIVNDFDVKGSLFVNGVPQVPPIQTLTAYYDITSFGDPGVKENIEAANIAISAFLPRLFSTSTTEVYHDVAYPYNSDVKVICNYSGTPSVRRFRLVKDPLHPSIKMWRWYDVYYNTLLSTVTNVVTL